MIRQYQHIVKICVYAVIGDGRNLKRKGFLHIYQPVVKQHITKKKRLLALQEQQEQQEQQELQEQKIKIT